MAIHCAILDDYQNVALKLADWGKVKDRVEIKVFREHLGGSDKVIAGLQGFEIIVAMRERTAFPKQVLDALPELKLLITTGMRNASIDTTAAKARGKGWRVRALSWLLPAIRNSRSNEQRTALTGLDETFSCNWASSRPAIPWTRPSSVFPA